MKRRNTPRTLETGNPRRTARIPSGERGDAPILEISPRYADMRAAIAISPEFGATSRATDAATRDALSQ